MFEVTFGLVFGTEWGPKKSSKKPNIQEQLGPSHANKKAFVHIQPPYSGGCLCEEKW